MKKSREPRTRRAGPAQVDPALLLESQVIALEQLLELHERAVLDQSAKLEGVRAALATRVDQLKRSNTELVRINEQLSREISERMKAQEGLRRSERMASIGALAAGLAHEINNPLGLIMLALHKAAREVESATSTRASIEAIQGYVERCALIVKSVLRFAREESTDRWPEDLNDVVQHARDLTRDLAKRHEVRLSLDLAEGLPVVTLNPTEMEQVVVNLINNGVQACRPGGTVTVRTRHTGSGVRIIVSDDGCGMSEIDRQHAFDPFYTTKSASGGTGLGLSTCQVIVSDMGGRIAIESGLDRGTEVTVEVPVGGSS